MKFLMWLLWHFIPREEGEGGEGEGSGGEGEGAGDEGQQAPIGGDDPDRKPDWVAEKFWNPDMKEVRAEPLHKAYNELEGKLRQNRETIVEEVRAEMIASAPESYEVELSEDLEIPEGVELNLTAEDPMVQWFFGFAKENGMSQEIVTKAINEYVGIELSGMPNVTKEIEKLGDHGQDRMLRVHNWLESKLSADQFASLNPLLSSANQIEALESLMKTSGPSDFEGDSASPPMTLDELRSMQNDPRYHTEKDPAFIKKVSDGYKRLYNN